MYEIKPCIKFYDLDYKVRRKHYLINHNKRKYINYMELQLILDILKGDY